MEKIYNKRCDFTLGRIGFGGIPIQNESNSTAKEVIDTLIKQEVNYIDSARGYRDSEKIIGEAIKGRRDKFILATKSMSRTYSEMKRDIDISLVNFQTDYIDVYQLHNPNMEQYEKCISDGGAYFALLDAKKMGKIRHIGITAHKLEVLERAVSSGLFDTIMYPFNIVEVQGRSFFKKCRELGILTIAMKPLAGGALDNSDLAIKFLLNEEVDVIIPGMKNVTEVIKNTSIIKEKLTESELEEVERLQKEMGNDFCRRCGYCAPCTKGIDIPNCFVFEGYYKRYNLKEWAIERYNSLKAHASDCIECGKCMSRCPYELDIIKKLKGVKETFGK